MLRIILEFYDVIISIRTAHQMRLGTAAHPPYLFEGSQHSRLLFVIMLMPLTAQSKNHERLEGRFPDSTCGPSALWESARRPGAPP